MTVLRRSIRNMMDASLDLTCTEKLRSSDNTGWTTQVGNYYQSNQSTAYTGYNTFGDATLDASGNPDPQFPHQDGVTRNTSNNTLSLSGITNVGLKHYFHQLQAMRGSNDFGGSNAMGGPGAGSNLTFNLGSFTFTINTNPSLPTNFQLQGYVANGVPAVGTFSGTSNLYRQTLIRMGDMRGFKYHTSTNSIWDVSSNATAEELRATGMIRIGRQGV